MISTQHKFIFLHVPKTGGNSVQSALLPFSDDSKVCNEFQDGIQRFELQGALTAHKHVTLADYANALGGDLGRHHVVVTVRPPFERMVSFYFSPHRWRDSTPVFTERRFFALMRHVRPLSDFLMVGQELRRPDSALRFGHLQTDFERFYRAIGLPGRPPRLDRLNVTRSPRPEVAKVLASRELRRAVEQAFAGDCALVERLTERSQLEN